MSHKVNGVVDNSYQKEKPKRAGGTVKIWYVDVDDVTFSTGFKKLFEKGEMINVEIEQKFGEWQFKGNNPASNLPIASGSAPKKQANVTPFKGGGGRNMGSFPIDPKDGQMSIIRQSSMTRAVEIIKHMIDAKLFKPETEEEYMTKLIEIALEITDFSSGQDITKIMELQKAKQLAKEAV